MNQSVRLILQVILCSLLPCLSSIQAEDNNRWLTWRGPNRDGYTNSNPWPQKLDEDHLKLQWEQALDNGYSGPIVTEELVIVTETRGKKDEAVVAYDRATGSKRWEASWPGAMTVPFFAKANGDWIRSTPASDGKSIFVAGMRDLLVSLDIATGKENWRVDFTEKYKTPLPDFGFVCSPMVDGEFLYVQAGGGFCKLRCSDGEIVWRTLADGGGMNGSAFSSPMITTLHNTRMILVQTRTHLVGVNPEDGKEYFRRKVEAMQGMNILTPTVWNDSIFTSSYGGKTWLFGITPKADAPWDIATTWENKVEGYMSSPVIVKDHLYLHLRNQRFTCFDLKSGKQTFTTRPYGKYWSMVTNGEQILALDERGELMLIQAEPSDFTLIDERKVTDNDSWAHVAVVGNQIFVRHLKGISVYRWE